MRKYTKDTVRQFKGMDNSGYEVPEDTYLNLLNLRHTPYGSLKKRPGIQPATGAAGVSGNYKLLGRQITVGSSDYLYFASTTRVYRMNADGSGVITEILLTAASIAGVYAGVQGYNGSFYLFRNNAAPVTVTAAGATGASPTATLFGSDVLWFKNRFWTINMFATVAGEDSKLFYSDPVTTLSPPNANVYSDGIGLLDGQVCTSLIVYSDQIWIFKDRSIYTASVDGDRASFSIRKITDSYGCVASHSPTIINGMLYFWSREGLIRTDGQGFENLSVPIQRELATYNVPVNSQGLERIHGGTIFYYDNKIILMPCTGPVQAPPGQTDWFVFDLIHEAWTKWYHVGKMLQYAIVCENANFTYDTYIMMFPYGGTKPSFIKVSSFSSDTTADITDAGASQSIYCELMTTSRTFESPSDWKRHMFLDVEIACAGTYTVAYLRERLRSSGPYSVASGTLVSTLPALSRAPAVGRFRELRTQISQDTTQYFEILSLTHALLPGDNVAYAH